ncbi:acriflavine resistance protein B [Ectothiorhodospira shaposhnikovii]|uniref:efflux RND transporter permease subunit n=1 Tax=Ectothiorhodospira shaposhnikovii TaxID=1054 RepID=UPI001906213A|nr:efflux RND transporter permease subunit [Ectothiorhodospira shaposhnikovii]MBK1674926.1 acriflavine resistance protein B [Ectothiorhodospira shaposhnikovii]
MSEKYNYRGWIPWFTANPVAANLLLILIIVAGLSTVGDLRKEAFPAADPESITVSVTYLSGSAQQSEEGVAIKLEDALEGVTGIKSITSISNSQGVTVTVKRHTDYDLDTLLGDVKNKVDSISNFPANAEKPLVEKGLRESHAITLQLYGDVNRETLQQLGNRLKADLLSQRNISRVTFSGWVDPVMAIEIDESRLQAYDLSLTDVQDAINRFSSNTSTAILRHERLYLQIKASEQAYYATEFARIPLISTARHGIVTLGDVARIRDTFNDTTPVLSRFNGRNSLALAVISIGDDDILKTVAAAEDVITKWRENGTLPEGVNLASWSDSSENISSRLKLLVENALMGIVLVFLLLAIFLNFKVAFWVAMGLPFIFFGTLFFMGMSFIDLSLNEFTTFGFIMALGIVVDDAVVVGESIYATREKYGDTLTNTIKGTMAVAVPTLFGAFTTVAAFAALSQTTGMLGQLYAQFAVVVTICLLFSVVESKLILPAHLSRLHTHRNGERGNWASRRWQRIQNGANGILSSFNNRIYKPLVGQTITHRYAVVLFGIGVLFLVIAMPFNGTVRISFFPDVPAQTVTANLTMHKDASYGLTHNALRQLEAQAFRLDEALREDSGHKEIAIANLQVISEADQSGSVTVELTDNAPYTLDEFTRRWRALAGNPEGVKTLSIQSRQMMVDALRIELRSSDDDVLTQAGTELKEHLQSIGAISGLDDNLTPTQPQLNLKLTDQGKVLGITTDDLAAQLYQAFSGQIVQRYQRGGDEVEVKVRYPESDRSSAADVLKAKIRTPSGDVVPISAVAEVTYGFSRDSITRIDGKRAIYITSDVDKEARSVTELVRSLQNTIANDLQNQYPGLDIKFGGEAEQQQESSSSMVAMFLLALLAIYMLLAVPLKSYIQPIVIMTAIPFGIVGAILGHWLNDLPLSILSFNGVIALSGVVVNNSLLLVSQYNQEVRKIKDHKQAMIVACIGRLRPVLLTSATTFAGLIPILSETSMQAQFLIPAAVSLAYGVVFATVITLILIPSLVTIQEDITNRINRLTSGKSNDVGNYEPC